METEQARAIAAPRGRSRVLVLAALGCVLAVAMFIGTSLGPLGFQPGLVWQALREPQDPANALVVAVRLPRTLVAVMVGASLAVAGAAMQAVFRNPLAEPGITGVSSGAAVVAVVMIVFGGCAHSFLLPFGAFAGALIAVLIVQFIGGRGGTHTILLVGIALNALLGAIIAAVIANAVNAEDARSAMFWLNGDLSGRTLADAALVAVPLAAGLLAVMFYARELNLLAAGEAIAHTSGMQVARTKQIVLFAAALTTAAGVAITGIISFVGLVVPHVVRLIWGSDHRLLLPASALLGATGLLVADLGARLVWQPVALQTGTVTALVGAPFLLFLVMRHTTHQQSPEAG